MIYYYSLALLRKQEHVQFYTVSNAFLSAIVYRYSLDSIYRYLIITCYYYLELNQIRAKVQNVYVGNWYTRGRVCIVWI